MNRIILMGRVVKDIDVRYTTGENAMAVARFSVAVNRRVKNAQGTYDADFPSCVAFGKTAEFISKYFHKGDMISLEGELRTGRYDKDGVTHYTTDVNVSNVEFCGGKSNGDSAPVVSGGTIPARQNNSFVNIQDNSLDEELPFE